MLFRRLQYIYFKSSTVKRNTSVESDIEWILSKVKGYVRHILTSSRRWTYEKRRQKKPS